MTKSKYGNYQYETSPRKIDPYIEPKKHSDTKKDSNNKALVKKQEKAKKQVKLRLKTVLCIAIIFGCLFVISYRNSLINESFSQNEKLKNKLAVMQKENEQLQVNIENSLNLKNIEKLAQEKLGMKKLDSNQKVYVSLPKKDYVEPAVEEVVVENKETNWLQNIINMIFNK